MLVLSKMTGLELKGIAPYYEDTDVERLKTEHNNHYDTLDFVIDFFEKNNIKPRVIEKMAVDPRDFQEKWDCIVSVGGDGTVMDTARYIFDETLFMGIKSSPGSYGAHCNTSYDQVEEHLNRLLKKDFGIEKRTRINCSINGDKIQDLSLNEIVIKHLYGGYAVLEVYDGDGGYRTEGSGIIVSTYKGRTGQYDNEPFIDKKTEQVIQESKFKEGEENMLRYKQLSARSSEGPGYGLIKPGVEVKIKSKILVNGVVTFDGSDPTKPRPRVYELGYGQNLKIRVSDNPLHVVKF